MAEEPKPQPATEPDATKKRLLARVGVAGLLIVVLIAVLALFESYSKRELAPTSAVTQAPIPIAPSAPPAVQSAERPIGTPAPPAEQPAGKEADFKQAMEPPAEPEDTAAPTLAPRPSQRRKAAAAASRFVPAGGPEEAAVIQPPRPSPALAAGFVIQLGVFTNVSNAEELHARLTRSGIPSQIEARVFAGPFKSKEDAEAAQAKLKSVGLHAGLLLPFRTR